MTSYMVTSDRLGGFKRGDIVTDKDLEGVDVEALVEAGHLSTQSTKKSGKTKETETAKD
jgi:hypothetical protein